MATTTTTKSRFARYLAAPVISAGIFAGTLGLAGAANAGTYSPDSTPRPGIVATPTIHAPTASEAMPGWGRYYPFAYPQSGYHW